MGTYTHLTIADYPVVYSKSEIVPEAMTVFRETDRQVFTRRLDERNRLVWGEGESNDEVEEAIEYSCEAQVAIERLNIMGFSLNRARREYEEGRRFELAEFEERARDGDDQWFRDEWEVLKTLDFERYSQGLAVVLRDGLRPRPFDDHKAAGLEPGVKYILDEPYERTLGFLGGDVRLLLRVICGLVDPGARVVQDITDLVDAGYYGRNEPVCANAIRNLTEGHPENAPRIVLTEGSTDGVILKTALEILYPHLQGYYSFLDFDSSRSSGGAGHLVSVVKAFAGAGITNRVIALFDNDTAAREAVRVLRSVHLPPNLAVRHYPDLEFLRAYPTLGPGGLTMLNVNGLAASIELYLGEDVLRDDDGAMIPIRWKGCSDALSQYQGEVGNKARLLERFNEKAVRCRADPSSVDHTAWSGLDAILRTVFVAFDEA
jgi:hypothetical protein